MLNIKGKMILDRYEKYFGKISRTWPSVCLFCQDRIKGSGMWLEKFRVIYDRRYLLSFEIETNKIRFSRFLESNNPLRRTIVSPVRLDFYVRRREYVLYVPSSSCWLVSSVDSATSGQAVTFLLFLPSTYAFFKSCPIEWKFLFKRRRVS